MLPNVPLALLGKILFRSDREWSEQEKQLYAVGTCRQADRITCGPDSGKVSPNERMNTIYVYDPQTGQLGRLTSDWPYYVAHARNAYSADTTYRTYNKQLLWTNVEVERPGGHFIRIPTPIFAIHYYDYKYNVERQVTELGSGWAWDPVWSPTSDQIAFVSNVSRDDEIWVINHDGRNALQLTSSNEAFNAREIGKNTFIPELNGFPSWSPDGSKIVFWSNRTGNRQLWIMNADGSDQQLLMGWDNWTPYNDWDPVWVKYLDPPPPEAQQ
jgi:Tol biopolymer transport system component